MAGHSVDKEIDWETFPYRNYPVTDELARVDSAIIELSERYAAVEHAVAHPELTQPPYPDIPLFLTAITGELGRYEQKRELLYRIAAMQDLDI